jgi:16S rRNA (cytidine1402-2'-O)-methyltransferase
LADLADVLGDRQIAVARELTKIHEEVWRGNLKQALKHFKRNPPRGEFTLVIAGAEEEVWDEEQVRSALAELLSQGLDKKKAIKRVAKAAHWPGSQVYKVALDMS